jgi:PGF-pre-PGF domain-containing protein
MQIRKKIIAKIVLVVLLFIFLFNNIVSAEITGKLTVKIGPPEVIPEARWKLSNGEDLGWQDSGEYVYNVPVGKNQILFSDVDGWCKPPHITVEIKKGNNIVYMNYSLNSCEIPEDIKNIGCDEFLIKDIYNKNEVFYNFQSSCNIIKNIKFKALSNYDRIVSKIAILKNTSTLVDYSPPPFVYKNFNVIIGSGSFLSENNVENLSITFSVEKSWIEQNDIMLDSINLYMFYEGTWNYYQTEMIDEDSTHIFFTSYPNIEKWGSMAVCGQNNFEPISYFNTVQDENISIIPSPEIVENKEMEISSLNYALFLFGITIISYFILKSTSSK